MYETRSIISKILKMLSTALNIIILLFLIMYTLLEIDDFSPICEIIFVHYLTILKWLKNV